MIEAYVYICFIAYKVYKELDELISINKIGMSADKELDAIKTITSIKVRPPLQITLFLPERHHAVKSLLCIYLTAHLNLDGAMTKLGNFQRTITLLNE